ncbi:MAG: hypothetical protein WCW16_01845 [Candidatus Magasanikbacteria bacterium]
MTSRIESRQSIGADLNFLAHQAQEDLSFIRAGQEYLLPGNDRESGSLIYWNGLIEGLGQALEGADPKMVQKLVLEAQRIREVLQESRDIPGAGVRRETLVRFKDDLNRAVASKKKMAA